MKVQYSHFQKANFSANALMVLNQRYLLRDQTGQVCETTDQMFQRIARVVSAVEEKEKKEIYLDLFERLLNSLCFVPNSPTFTGAGTSLGQLAACFVLPIEDDIGKTEDGIFSILRSAALIQQTGGGNGFSFSRLRPQGSLVQSYKGVASGPVGFLRVFDAAFGEIAQGGTRHGANMGILRCDHPDIFDFIICKGKEGKIANFNISVAVTDQFMKAVEDDADFDLIDPHTQKAVRTLKAREIFARMAEFAHRNGEPGILFIDQANRSNPVPHLYELEATNPCGEQWLGPYENCCLGSINLVRHLTSDGHFDWQALAQTVELSTRFLDDVVDANRYVPSVPQLKEAGQHNRRIGLGIMGLGDVFYALGIRYGSEKSLEFASQLMEFVRFYAMRSSIDLAAEKGSFATISGSIYDPHNLRWSPPESKVPYKTDFGRPVIEWGDLVRDIKDHGIRNSAQTTIAPTGTIATVAGLESYGCEPVFALAYQRTVIDRQQKVPLWYTSSAFDEALAKLQLPKELRERVLDIVRERGSCQEIEELPLEFRQTFVVSSDIPWKEHVLMQAVLQAFVDNSISKTVNFASNVTVDDVWEAYLMAWRLGCKGLTIYRQGSREEVILATNQTLSKPKVSGTDNLEIKPRPQTLSGKTYRIETPLGTAFITINDNGGGNPFEVFVTVGKAGSAVGAEAEAIGRACSLLLRTAPNSKKRALEIIDQFAGIGGSRSVGLGAKRISSLADAVAAAFKLHLSLNGRDELVLDNVVARGIKGDLCPRCGEATLVKEEGCQKCYSCSFSQC